MIFCETLFAKALPNAHVMMPEVFLTEIILMHYRIFSKMAHLHPAHFIRQFKKLTGTTPMNYITAKRMYYAWSKLANTNMPISEIMERIGYSDHALFSRTFKKYYKASHKLTSVTMCGQSCWQARTFIKSIKKIY